MKERPILFSAPMVRALLDGTKTQTRRAVKPQPPAECSIHYMLGNESWMPESKRSPLRHHWEAWGGPLHQSRPPRHLCGSHSVRCPYGQPGDRIWVKETWRPKVAHGCTQGACDCGDVAVEYRADAAIEHFTDRQIDAASPGWCMPKAAATGNVSPLFMPRWASRLVLEITEVRVERLQEMSAPDAWAEGIAHSPDVNPLHAFEKLWTSINGEGSWAANPWVWALTFRRVPA